METSSLVKYFDGKSSRFRITRIKLYTESLHLFDGATGTYLTAIELKDCHATYVNNAMYLYLNKQSTSYVVVDDDNALYYPLKDVLEKAPRGFFEKLMQHKLPALLGLFLLLVGGAYFIFVQLVPYVGLKLISTQQEIDLGDNFYASFMSNEKIDRNATAIVQKFADNLELSDTYPITVTVVKENQVNAFALPGGHIVVYSGILKHMNSYQELAALLGHEATHVNKRHTLKGMLRSISSSVLISWVIGDGGGLSSVLVRNANNLHNLSFSRSLEEEADEQGMNIMVKDNVDPKGMQDLMVHLQEASGDIPSELSFLSSHPLTKDRIEKAKAFAASHPIHGNFHPAWADLWDCLKENKTDCLDNDNNEEK
ncbi:M48 family metallopeptidase [Ferruginibacter albus]|uniref:M48 family metallopeptidase n=1 Tax=Ferruginibacter albus TaxID=2875540 RepID=UPI001CC35CAE|nr:M48 family metallopeptidase [Ferruginibacter albus]UAY51967.1 M48 family metallopeptidase [Ferruginibacter albus]